MQKTKSNPKLRFIVTAYLLVALAISFLLYGIYLFFTLSIDEEMKDYEQRKQFRQSKDGKRNISSNEKCFDWYAEKQRLKLNNSRFSQSH